MECECAVTMLRINLVIAAETGASAHFFQPLGCRGTQGTAPEVRRSEVLGVWEIPAV